MRGLDLPRIGIATVVAAGLSVGVAVAFVRYAQSTPDVGPTSATLEEAYSSLIGAGIGIALGGAFCALWIRRGPPVLSGLIAGLLAYVVILCPVFVATDDVGLDEDLNLGGLAFLALIGIQLGVFAILGATVARSIAGILQRGREQRRER